MKILLQLLEFSQIKKLLLKQQKKHGYDGNDIVSESAMVQLHQIDELDKDYDNNETMVED